MTPEELQYMGSTVQNRFEYLHLTSEQAEKIYQYEQEKNLLSKYHFSMWEEWDYENTVYAEILDNDQLKLYEEDRDALMKFNVDRLIELDTGELKNISLLEDALSFYQNQFLPQFFTLKVPSFVFLLHDEAKVNFIKAEYKKFVGESKRETLTSHFRHYRMLKPNQLKASLLRHRVDCLWPNYLTFKQTLDEPTATIVNYVKNKIRRYYEYNTEETMNVKWDELLVFNKNNFDKHYGENRGGWRENVQLTPEENKENKMMILLLLVKGGYPS